MPGVLPGRYIGIVIAQPSTASNYEVLYIYDMKHWGWRRLIYQTYNRMRTTPFASRHEMTLYSGAREQVGASPELSVRSTPSPPLCEIAKSGFDFRMQECH